MLVHQSVKKGTPAQAKTKPTSFVMGEGTAKDLLASAQEVVSDSKKHLRNKRNSAIANLVEEQATDKSKRQ